LVGPSSSPSWCSSPRALAKVSGGSSSWITRPVRSSTDYGQTRTRRGHAPANSSFVACRLVRACLWGVIPSRLTSPTARPTKSWRRFQVSAGSRWSQVKPRGVKSWHGEPAATLRMESGRFPEAWSARMVSWRCCSSYARAKLNLAPHRNRGNVGLRHARLHAPPETLDGTLPRLLPKRTKGGFSLKTQTRCESASGDRRPW
jgi:hypothetical protein